MSTHVCQPLIRYAAVGAADDGEEVFTAGLVTSAAQAVRRLCTEDPDTGRVRKPSNVWFDLCVTFDDSDDSCLALVTGLSMESTCCTHCCTAAMHDLQVKLDPPFVWCQTLFQNHFCLC